MQLTKDLRIKATRVLLTTALAGIMAVSLAACGGSASDNTSPTATPAAQSGATDGSASSGGVSTTDNPPAASGDVQQIDAKLSEWAVALSASEVNAGKVRFNVTNTGQFTHDLGVTDSSGKEVGVTPKFKAADGVQTLDVDLQPGTYTVLCDITGHPEKGMKTQLTVK